VGAQDSAGDVQQRDRAHLVGDVGPVGGDGVQGGADKPGGQLRTVDGHNAAPVGDGLALGTDEERI
jgi:hypothetical protein